MMGKEPDSQGRDRGGFTMADATIFGVAMAIGLYPILINQERFAGNPYLLFFIMLAIAPAIIGIKHLITSTRRPALTVFWSFVGGILGGGLAFLLTRWYIIEHPVKSTRSEDWGALAAGILYLVLLFLSPLVGFLVMFLVVVVACWWLDASGSVPKPGSRHSDLE